MSDNTCEWKSKFHLYYECNEPALPGDTYCILHSENLCKNFAKFDEKIESRIEEGKKSAVINFVGCYFPKKYPNYRFKNFNFSKTIFFNEAKFSQSMDFSNAIFNQKADFRGTKFSGAQFVGAEFLEWTDFSFAEFTEKVDFFGAEFSDVFFAGTTFERGANFSYTDFKVRASFISEDKKVIFGYPSFFQHTRFLGEVIFQDVDLSKCSFLHSNIDKVDFRYCEFEKKGRRKNVLLDELECDDNVAQKKVDKKEYEYVRRLYLELKRNFEEKKDWNTAGDFHFGEMECRRKMKGCWKRNIFSLEALYFGLSGYGERPWRAFRILLEFVLVLFPLLYMLSEGKTITNYFTSLLDSLNVATLIRLGKPTETITGFWKPIVAVTELIVVPILIALLALALRRKVKR